MGKVIVMPKKWSPKIFTFFEEVVEEYFLIILWIENPRFLSIKLTLPDEFLFLWASKTSGKLKVRTATHDTYPIVASGKNLKIGLSFNLGSERLKPATKPAILTAASLLEIQVPEKLANEAMLSDILIINIEEEPRWFKPIIPSSYSKELRDFVLKKWEMLGNVISIEKESGSEGKIEAPSSNFLSGLEKEIIASLKTIKSSLRL